MNIFKRIFHALLDHLKSGSLTPDEKRAFDHAEQLDSYLHWGEIPPEWETTANPPEGKIIASTSISEACDVINYNLPESSGTIKGSPMLLVSFLESTARQIRAKLSQTSEEDVLQIPVNLKLGRAGNGNTDDG
jgi:hypothetical protein